MFNLTFVKSTQEDDHEYAFQLSGSDIPEVNGRYYEVFTPEDVYIWLIQEGQLVDDFGGINDNHIYTNGNSYVVYGANSTLIVPIGGGYNNYYYRSTGMDGTIESLIGEDWEYNWLYHNTPGEVGEEYWSDKVFFTYTSLDGNEH